MSTKELPLGKRQRHLAQLQQTHGHKIQALSQTRTATRTAIKGTTVQHTEEVNLPPTPHPVAILPPQRIDLTNGAAGPSNLQTNDPIHKLSQTAQEFMDAKLSIHSIIMDQNASPLVGTQCPCGVVGALRTTRCSDCKFSVPTCANCFILAHQMNPTHWAEKWDSSNGFFVRHDISCLRSEGYGIPFGHHGLSCPKYSPDSHDTLFCIVDTNGIHSTRVRFCECTLDNRSTQLLKSGLFPATLTQPRMAFSFSLLRWFHKLHLESKVSAYDFIGSLRRLTDNAFAHRVVDPYPQFRLVMRIWRVITAERRLGHIHGIDDVLPHRQPGNLIVHCPACPEPGFNAESGWQETPADLRHLNQTTFTADGNHHLNKFVKNTDPNDLSLFSGRAYFPEDSQFQQYLQSIPDKDREPEKRTCNHLNALKKQDRKKFRNMDRTGVVNIQCDHIFIKATVDLQLGERFANTDYAFAHAIKQIRASVDPDDPDKYLTSCDYFFSYDITCGYCKNAVKRFLKQFPEMASRIKATRWLIPVVHVHNHQDNCMYLYSSAYVPGAGHKQGETAEMTWAEFNQLGPQTRQMNNGHRQDTIIDHYGDWNWKKTANMSTTLFNDVTRSKKLFIEKREAFKALVEIYRDRVPIWNTKDRTLRVVKGGQVHCVYRQNEANVPSQRRIYQAILTELDSRNSSSPTANTSAAAAFLNEGLEIWTLQRKLLFEIKHHENTDFGTQRESLRTRLNEWRRLQMSITPQVGDYVEQHILSLQPTDEVEQEILYLPSEFSSASREKLGLTSLGEYQRRLLEGACCDAIQRIRMLVKLHSALRQDKKKKARGQYMNTQSMKKLQKAIDAKLVAIEVYNALRQAMIALGLSDDDPMFPPLSVEDTFRKTTQMKRSVGDSQRTDGLLWTTTGVTTGVRRLRDGQFAVPDIAATAVGTQGPKGKKRKREYTQGDLRKGKRRRAGDTGVMQMNKAREDGWIWRFKIGNLSDDEIREWIDEGDSIQFFRAEAEMQRWQEEWESKQADFLRCIRAFTKSSDVWHELSKTASHDGEVAYAKKKSVMFQEMAEIARAEFLAAGYEDRLATINGDKTLTELIEADRNCSENIIVYYGTKNARDKTVDNDISSCNSDFGSVDDSDRSSSDG